MICKRFGESSQPSRHFRRALSAGTGEAPNVVLLEVVTLLVPDGGDDLVDGDVVLAVQGAPHPQRRGSWLEVCLLLGILLGCFEM